MWGRFFDSIGGQDDNESAVSGSNFPTDINIPPPYPDSPLKFNPQSPEVHPNDSASVVDEEPESIVPGRRAGVSSVGGIAPAVLPIDDGTFVFKFRTPSGHTHRFQARNDNVENLRDIVAGKLSVDPFFTTFKVSDGADVRPDPLDFRLTYTDADGDTVLITSDGDVTDAVKIARNAGSDRVVLYIQGGKPWDEAGAQEGEAKAKQVAAAAQKEATEVDKVDAALPEGVTFAPPTRVHAHVPDDVYGIPRDLVLPASIGALAAVIVGIFAISRISSR